MPESFAKLRVAILGGGLAGVFLLRGLLQLEQYDVHIFESRPMFCEQGAGISMAWSAISALRSISPSLVEDLDRAGGVKNKNIVIRVGQGEHAGTQVPTVKMPEGTNDDDYPRTVYRQAFLTQLLASVPKHIMHAGKRLAQLEEVNLPTFPSSKYRLHFEDGSVEDFDVVFGADGIHGRVREFVLDKNDPSLEVKPCGVWHLPVIVPYDKAKAALGKWLDPNTTDQSLWIGSQTFMMYDFCDDRDSVQLIAVSREEAMLQSRSWTRTLSHSEFRTRFANQMPHLSEGLVDLICEQNPEEIIAFNEMEHRNTTTYARRRVCILGDAAHSISPSQASGGALSAEDACVLTALLREAKTLREVEVVFQVYSDIRRPRAERIAETSNRVGLIFNGSLGTNPQILNDYLSGQWIYIYEWRAEPTISMMLQEFNKRLSE